MARCPQCNHQHDFRGGLLKCLGCGSLYCIYCNATSNRFMMGGGCPYCGRHEAKTL